MSLSIDAVQMTTLDGTITDVSESTCSQFQYEREELIGKNCTTIMPFKHARNHNAYLESFKRTLRELKSMNSDAETRNFLRRQSVLTGRTRGGDVFPLYLYVRSVCVSGVDDMLIASLHNCS
uniref:Sensor protein fixL n=1 Tax=Lygus hesperus TaxID=30085 RepID=A0A0A9WQF1_LYGHE